MYYKFCFVLYILKIESKDKLKETDIKNHRGYYFDSIKEVSGIYSEDVLLAEKLNTKLSWFRNNSVLGSIK